MLHAWISYTTAGHGHDAGILQKNTVGTARVA